MELTSRAERAAYNNALWCDAVCRAHGAAGEFGDATPDSAITLHGLVNR
jgi:hypothetical protein